MSPKLKAFIQSWLITTVAVLAAAHVVNGITYEKPMDLLVATLLLGLLNAFVKPVLMFLSLPLLLLTLGLFTLVINAGLLLMVGELVKGFHVASFWAACKGAILMAFISIILNSFARAGNSRVTFARSKAPPQGPPDKGGDVIDV
jgi:putative membrane protein